MAPTVSEAKILERRFELMKTTYMNNQLNSRNKFLVINWFLEKIGDFQKDFHSCTYELLWKTFYDILDTERHISGDRILLKSDAVINLLHAIKDYPFSCSWASVILTSIDTFLQSSTVNATLIVDVDKLLLLLISALRIICKIYECGSEDLQSLKHATDLSNTILDILENLPASNEEGKASILAENLQDLAVFMHIAENDKELNQLSQKLAKKMIDITFNLKRKHFETLLTPEISTEVVTPNTYVLEFFQSLQKLLFTEDIVYSSVFLTASCGTLMKKLLSTFLIQNKSCLHSLKVASLFFAVAGLDIPIVESANSCCNSLFKERKSNSDVSLIGISNLLESCLNVPQYFTSMAVPVRYLKPSVWLKGVSARLLDVKNSKHKSYWLKCFQILLMISPSILEDDILSLIKIALLNTSVHSTESKKQYSQLFHALLQAHSKLHQVPKFFVKLLLALTECIKENSGGNLLESGQVLLPVQESIAKCIQELPYGQMIELWKMFIETFTTLENMSQVFMIRKGFIFFVAQLFSTFLLHAQLFQANIPTNIYSQFDTLIENTSEEIKKIITSLKEADSKFAHSQRSVLLLCYAIGEVKLAYNAYYEKSSDKCEAVMCEEAFDFSILHDYLDKDYSPVLQNFMKSDDKILSSLIFQLLLQKIKAIQFKESCSESDMTHMQKCISVALNYLQESCATESWDKDICMINDKNYGTVSWMMFLKLSPLMLIHLNPMQLYSFCSTAQSIMFQDDCSENGAKSIILSSFEDEIFQESRLFQIAFVSALWKKENLFSSKKRSHEEMEAEQSSFDKIFSLLSAYHSKALKYTERTPKSNKQLGSVWEEIKEISDLLNENLSCDSLPKDRLLVSRIKDMIKFLRCLPLEYLLPGTQMKCIIGLSVILFLAPQSCKSDEVVFVVKEISQLLLTIFEGVRSIWLFDFVPSGPYLKYIVKSVEFVINAECDDNHDWAVQLFEQLASLIIKSVDSLEAVMPYISEIPVNNKNSKTVLITLCALLKKLSQVLQYPHKQEKYKETLATTASVTLQCFVKQMKTNFQEDMTNADYSYFIKCYMQAIEIICGSSERIKGSKNCFQFFPAVLEKALNKVESSSNDALSDLCLLFISKVCKHMDKLSAYIPADFISISWEKFLIHFEEKKKKQMEYFLTNQSLDTHVKSPAVNGNVCVLCSSISNKVSNEENCKSGQKSGHSSENVLTLKEVESLKVLSQISTPETLAKVFHDLLEKMGVNADNKTEEKDVFSMQMAILIFQLIIDSNNEKCQQPVLNKPIQKFLSNLYIMANEACNSVVCQTMVVIPILEFISFAVQGNKGLPKDILLQSLHCIAPISLEVWDGDYELYVKIFSAVWNVVYNLFMHCTPIILGAPAVLLIYVKKLLRSIVKAGADASLSKCDTNTLQQVHLCAQNMTRLLTVITRQKKEFSKLVPYLITYYVDTVQHITLNSNIKETILLGIHRLLDICGEDSVKMQAVNIDSVSREIYTNLVNNYKRNKSKGFA